MSEQRPRVLMLATRVPARSGDGTPSFVLDHAVALADRFDITVLAPRIGGVGGVTEIDGVTVRRFAYLPRRWERLADDAIMPQLGRSRLLWLQAAPLVASMLLAAVREHRRTHPAVVHAHWIVPAGMVALLLRALFSTPYLVTSHGADAFMLEGPVLRALKRAIVRRSTRFVGVSREIAERFDGLGVPVEVQPVGVDMALWQGLTGARTPEHGRVLFVGRLVEKKGVMDAVDAVRRLDDFQLRIVGDGPLREEFERVSAPTTAEPVRLLGRLPRERVAAELQRAMCVAIPSVTAADGDRDGTPSVVAEAIAAGVPVVASRVAGIVDHIIDGETGLLHDPGDIAGLAACLRRLAANPDLGEDLAERARTRATHLFDSPAVADRYARWFKGAIASRTGDGDDC